MAFWRFASRRLRHVGKQTLLNIFLFVVCLFLFLQHCPPRDGAGQDTGKRAKKKLVDDYLEKRDALIKNIETFDTDNQIRRLFARYDVSWEPSLLSVQEAWNLADEWISTKKVHPDYAQELGCVLHHLATAHIESADTVDRHKGSQNKLILTLEGGHSAAFKPKWYSRDWVNTGEPYSGHDRHNGEVASYHLNRILGFDRTPLAVGRRINLKKEILPVATERLAETFIVRDNNTCFLGKCKRCSTLVKDAACGEGDIMEGVMQLWFPDFVELQMWPHPWTRTYLPHIKAPWETDDEWCSVIKKEQIFKKTPLLMNLIDIAVFDYLVGNADRHSYETIKDHRDSMVVLLDNGKTFGNPDLDETSILMPLLQCCQIREKTYRRLLQLSNGVLSRVLRQVTRHDPIADPLLTQPHFDALERRLNHIIAAVDWCLLNNSPQYVILKEKNE